MPWRTKDFKLEITDNAQAVKIEGGRDRADIIEALTKTQLPF